MSSRRLVSSVDKQCSLSACMALFNTQTNVTPHQGGSNFLFCSILVTHHIQQVASLTGSALFVLSLQAGVGATGWQKGKVRSRWSSCLLLLHRNPLSLTGNKQSFSTDRYMLNHCYLCTETSQIMDYSSLVLTFGLSSICASVGQSHTRQRVSVYFPERDKTWCNTGVWLHVRMVWERFDLCF